MPHNYTRTDQVRFLTEWFDSWSEMQREDFLPIMVQVLNPGDHVNGLVGSVSVLNVGGRRPSLFDCQVKLFQDWYENWTPEERERLIQHFTTSDPDFASKLHKSYASEQIDEVELTASSPVLVDDEKDDGVSPGSHSSSPLSSLSQPLSPHDSGLEENHLDLEATPELVVKEDDADQERADTACDKDGKLIDGVEVHCDKEEASGECANDVDTEVSAEPYCVEREV